MCVRVRVCVRVHVRVRVRVCVRVHVRVCARVCVRVRVRVQQLSARPLVILPIVPR